MENCGPRETDIMEAIVFISFEQSIFFLMRGIAVCSLAQLYSTNKHIPSFATAAKRSFILNSILTNACIVEDLGLQNWGISLGIRMYIYYHNIC